MFFRASLEKKVVNFGGSDSGKGFISSGGHLVGVDQVLVRRLLAEVALGLLWKIKFKKCVILAKGSSLPLWRGEAWLTTSMEENQA